MKYLVKIGCNYRLDPKDPETRSEPGDVVEIPDRIAKALGPDVVEKAK